MIKQEIDFIKFNPTQNMTILVNTEHPVEDYKYIASKIMSYDNVYAEQVGFIGKPLKDKADANLYMAGGEFCGNACMALAALVASRKNLVHNNFTKIFLEVSGTEELVMCHVKRSFNKYYCEIKMPIPENIEQRSIKYDKDYLETTVIQYKEFVHIVIEVEQFTEIVRRSAEGLAKLLGSTLETNLIGILLYKSKSNELAPLIYIPHLDSLVWERGCGSGTASIGAYLYWKNKEDIAAPIKQPGGTIKVMVNSNQGNLISLKIEGSVGIVAKGKAFIDV
jgi:diaminopimelate epimerase